MDRRIKTYTCIIKIVICFLIFINVINCNNVKGNIDTNNTENDQSAEFYRRIKYYCENIEIFKDNKIFYNVMLEFNKLYVENNESFKNLKSSELLYKSVYAYAYWGDSFKINDKYYGIYFIDRESDGKPVDQVGVTYFEDGYYYKIYYFNEGEIKYQIYRWKGGEALPDKVQIIKR